MVELIAFANVLVYDNFFHYKTLYKSSWIATIPLWAKSISKSFFDLSKVFLKYGVFLQIFVFSINRVFLRCFRDPIRVPRISNRVPRIRENYHRALESEKIGSLESEKSGPYRVPNLFFKKNWYKWWFFSSTFLSLKIIERFTSILFQSEFCKMSSDLLVTKNCEKSDKESEQKILRVKSCIFLKSW